MRYKEPKIGPTTQKVLLLLASGIVLGLTKSPRYQIKILKETSDAWKEINRRALCRAIAKLYQTRLIDAKENNDETVTMILTERGKKKALTYEINNMHIAPMKQWDKKWRIVLFDVPEKHKRARDAIAHTLKKIGFYRLQKSVFVHPHECKDEIDFVVEFFQLRQFVRFIIANNIDNELHLKQHFKLL
ncbi:MAG: CRISPR-associated endonuclease Cas2 [Patescibacteria group bacterium]